MQKAISKYWPIFVLPTLVAFIIGFIWPFIWGVYLSFQRFTTVSKTTFVGIQNYLSVFQDSTFLHAFGFTAAFTVVSTVLINVCAFAMIGDCLDYMEWKTGTRLTGMGSAIQSFVTKLGAALSTSFIILMYIIVDLDVGSINASVTANPLMMSHGVRGGIFSVVSLIPAISLLVCTIPMFFYNLTGDFREKMETELAAQREKKGITITD